MKCIVIDDDKISRVIIEKYAKKSKFLEIVGSYENPIEAINDNKISNIDLVFVDIEMPEMTGLEFMQAFNKLPAVIVISAKDKYAVKALELDAVDYLMKPIEYPRFIKAVNKIKEYKYNQVDNSKLRLNQGIFIKDGSSSLIRLKYDEIIWIEALENYVLITTESFKHTIHFTMKALEKQLPAELFMRIHRSFIVNIDKIEAIEDNSIIISFEGKRKILPLAKSFKDKLHKIISK